MLVIFCVFLFVSLLARFEDPAPIVLNCPFCDQNGKNDCSYCQKGFPVDMEIVVALKDVQTPLRSFLDDVVVTPLSPLTPLVINVDIVPTIVPTA